MLTAFVAIGIFFIPQNKLIRYWNINYIKYKDAMATITNFSKDIVDEQIINALCHRSTIVYLEKYVDQIISCAKSYKDEQECNNRPMYAIKQVIENSINFSRLIADL